MRRALRWAGSLDSSFGAASEPVDEFPRAANLAVPITVDPSFNDALYAQFSFWHAKRDCRQFSNFGGLLPSGHPQYPGRENDESRLRGSLAGPYGRTPRRHRHEAILSYGPWYQGRYDGFSVGLRKRMSKRFTVEALHLDQCRR